MRYPKRSSNRGVSGSRNLPENIVSGRATLQNAVGSSQAAQAIQVANGACSNSLWYNGCRENNTLHANKLHLGYGTPDQCPGFTDCSIRVDGSLNLNASGEATIALSNNCAGSPRVAGTACTGVDENANYTIQHTSVGNTDNPNVGVGVREVCAFHSCESGYSRSGNADTCVRVVTPTPTTSTPTGELAPGSAETPTPTSTSGRRISVRWLIVVFICILAIVIRRRFKQFKQSQD